MKKKLLLAVSVLLVAIGGVLGVIKLYRIHQRDQSGILLAFDDYAVSNWEEYLELFDEYDVKVTFFINASEPTDFCYHARERGHEIAFHTVGHVDLVGASEDVVYEQAIAPIEVFREKGFELSTFAYPYGRYSDELNEKLLEHYKVLRGAYELSIESKHMLREGFVEARSIDNLNYKSQEEYEQYITGILYELQKEKGMVICLYSHIIGYGDWCVSEEGLRFLIEKAEELGLKFYTYQQLQNW